MGAQGRNGHAGDNAALDRIEPGFHGVMKGAGRDDAFAGGEGLLGGPAEKIVEKRIEDGRNFAICEVRADKQGYKLVAIGTIKACVPNRPEPAPSVRADPV